LIRDLFKTNISSLISSFNETKDLQYLDADYADRLLKRKALEQIEDITKAFLAFDQDGNGVVTKKELRKVLYKYQIPLVKWKCDTEEDPYYIHSLEIH